MVDHRHDIIRLKKKEISKNKEVESMICLFLHLNFL